MILNRYQWTDKSITFLVSDIIEYDMREAGLSIIKERQLLPQDQIDKISAIDDKHQRHMKVGQAQRGNRPLREEMSRGVKEYRILFGEANQLTDDDILAIKNDAIFVKKFCYVTEFGDHIKFVEKNRYTAFMQFGPFEFYMNESGLDIKGMTDEKLPLHESGIIPIIRKVMVLLSQYDDQGARKYIVNTMDAYKHYKLPVECYREFNPSSGYRIWQNDGEQLVKTIGDAYKKDLIIGYNYINVLVPLLNVIMG